MKYLLIALLAFSQLQTIAQDGSGVKIKIQWVDNLPGDFSFAKKWDYSEGVYKNEFGQVSCFASCPEEVYTMMDSTGKIYRDSLEAFYTLVDTTHQYHSIKADAWCYEYAGMDFIECRKNRNGMLECETLMNAGTHCSLQFSFGDADKFTHQNKYCYPSVFLSSVYGDKSDINGRIKEKVTYPCTSGWIKVDKKSWDKGILKATFDFKFKNTDEKNQPIYWKGKILFKKI